MTQQLNQARVSESFSHFDFWLSREQGDQKWAFRPMSGILKGLLAEKTIVGPGPFFGHFQKLSGPAQKIQNLTIFWAKNGI